MSLTLSAYAKINLTLEALARRDDGYHEIVTVLQTISLADTLQFELGETLEFHCNVPSLESDDNLAVRAANLLREATGCHKGALIHLTKRIPVAAGLGSGATDAAAALVGLNQLWTLDLPLTTLMQLAARLGSDVAFFLHGGTALGKGRGEKVTPLPSVPELWMVLLRPPIAPIRDKTAELYSRLEASHFTSGRFADRLVGCLHEGGGIAAALFFNVFEDVGFDFFPQLSHYRARLLESGVEKVHLAGAGPALFALVSGEEQGRTVLGSLEAHGLEACLARTVEAVPLASV
jgi:4-diphosphocytidyl-2-C-methyl-D-erythritol kinase